MSGWAVGREVEVSPCHAELSAACNAVVLNIYKDGLVWEVQLSVGKTQLTEGRRNQEGEAKRGFKSLRNHLGMGQLAGDSHRHLPA